MKCGEITDYFGKCSSRRHKTHKRCCRCKVWLHRKNFGKHRGKKDGLAIECKQCHRKRTSWQSKTTEEKERIKLMHITKKYGLDADEYRQRFEDIDYKCPMCFSDVKPFTPKAHVDHRAGTGVVYTKDKKIVYSEKASETRGITCDHCNNVLAR